LNRVRDRKAALDADQQALLARLANDDESARKPLTKLSAEIQECDQDVAAFSAGVASNAKALTEARVALRRAEDQAAVDQLEAEMQNFGALDRELQIALQAVSTKASALIAAISAVGAKLAKRDPHRWNRSGYHLETEVRTAIFKSFMNLCKSGVPPKTFSESVAHDIRRIISELKFEACGRRMAATQRDQRLYVVRSTIFLYDVAAQAGDVFPLMPDDSETIRRLRNGSIEPFTALQQGAEVTAA
jgi:hypothetical protein